MKNKHDHQKFIDLCDRLVSDKSFAIGAAEINIIKSQGEWTRDFIETRRRAAHATKKPGRKAKLFAELSPGGKRSRKSREAKN